MKLFFGGQFTPKKGDHFTPESPGHFASEWVVNLNRNQMVSLSGFSIKHLDNYNVNLYDIHREVDGGSFEFVNRAFIQQVEKGKVSDDNVVYYKLYLSDFNTNFVKPVWMPDTFEYILMNKELSQPHHIVGEMRVVNCTNQYPDYAILKLHYSNIYFQVIKKRSTWGSILLDYENSLKKAGLFKSY